MVNDYYYFYSQKKVIKEDKTHLFKNPSQKTY